MTQTISDKIAPCMEMIFWLCTSCDSKHNYNGLVLEVTSYSFPVQKKYYEKIYHIFTGISAMKYMYIKIS